MSTYRLGVFCNTYEKIQELEEMVAKKSNECISLKKHYENLELSRQLEFISLKKSTELIFSNLKHKENEETYEEPEENEKKNKIPGIRNLKLLIKELVLQESTLRKNIYLLIDKEGKTIKLLLPEMYQKVDNFRSDFEKWVMRNEELEQRLVDVERNNINLIKVIKDLQKILTVKDKQFEDVVKLYSRIGGEMQATVDFMSVELNDRQSYIIKDLLPTSYQYFSKTLSDAHIQIYQKTQR